MPFAKRQATSSSSSFGRLKTGRQERRAWSPNL